MVVTLWVILAYAESIVAQVAKEKKAVEIIHAIAEGFSTLLTINAVWSSARHPHQHTPPHDSDAASDSDADSDIDADGDGNADGDGVSNEDAGIDEQDVCEGNIERSPEEIV